MSHSDVQYRLVVFDELGDPLKVRDLFSEVTGAHPTDAMQWVAKVPGVWPKMLREKETRRLLDGLYELEVAAEAWRSDAFPDISRPRTIHEASCLDGGFRVTGLRGEPTPQPRKLAVATGEESGGFLIGEIVMIDERRELRIDGLQGRDLLPLVESALMQRRSCAAALAS